MKHCGDRPRGDYSVGSLDTADNCEIWDMEYGIWNIGYGIHISIKDGMVKGEQSTFWGVQLGWLIPLNCIRLDRLDLTVERDLYGTA